MKLADQGKGGLAALARSVDQRDRRVLQGFGQTPLCEAGVESVLNHRPTVTWASAV